MNKRSPKIALVGNLANVAYQTCKFLRKRHIQADVFVHEYELTQPASNPENHDPGIWQDPPLWLKIVPNVAIAEPTKLPLLLRKIQSLIDHLYILPTLHRYDLIESFCLAPRLIRWVGRPYISFATGSDLRELALENSFWGRVARKTFQQAEVVFFGPDPGHLEMVHKLHLENAYPYRQIIDTDFYAPHHINRFSSTNEELIIFHPTRLDWASQHSRKWTKGNDKLFRAFARLIGEGYKAKLLYLKRGEDINPTERLIEQLGIGQYVEPILENMTKAQLCHYYNLADVVADQFDIGGFGLIGLEAMSCGRPVLVNVNSDVGNLCYDEFPPILNCATEQEIYNQLKQALNLQYREKIGEQARQWIMKYHHWEVVIDNLIKHYETVLGKPLR
jgi:glycosyltransferase involved in cell wall biosynthesis